MQGTFRLMSAVRLVAASVALALVTAAPVHAQNASTSEPGYNPTMEDWMAVNDVMYRYRLGVEKGDEEAERSAFWPDGRSIAIPSPGMEILIPLDGSPPRPLNGGALPNFPGSPPPGMSGPPPGMSGPPPGMSGPPPGAGGPPPGMSGPPPAPGGPDGDGYVVWHLPFESAFRFESPTRATHYQYFLSIYPEPERTEPGLPARETRRSIVGWPGHYEDILEKRDGEWRILERRSYINAK